MYFNPTGKSINIEATGGIIVKTNNGSFAIPADAGADLKFIPFNVSGSLPANKANKMLVGGKIDTTIYNDRKITFDDLRIVTTDSNGKYSKIYKGLAELYADGYSLLAIRGLGSANQSTYVLDKLPTELTSSIKNGDGLYIRQGTNVINSTSDWSTLNAYIGTATVKSIYIDPQDFYTALDANNSLLKFENSPDHPWIGNTAGNYVSSDIAGKSNANTMFTATITMPKGATAQLKFDWKVSCEEKFDLLDFSINGIQQTYIWGTTNTWATKTYNLSGGTSGTAYTFTWNYTKDISDNAGEDTAYVKNIVITDLVLPTVTLQSIRAPTTITGLANGTAKTAEALGLPSTVTLVTNDGSVSANVTWDVNASGYNVATTTAQTFTVNGTVTLPSGVINTNNSVALTTSISVTVNDVRHVTIDECFIATAAFGSKFQPAVTLLRHFRDEYLLTNSVGVAFVKFYYQHSPPIAHYIAGNESLKLLVRILLAPIIGLVYFMYYPLYGVMGLALLSMIFAYQVRRQRKYLQV